MDAIDVEWEGLSRPVWKEIDEYAASKLFPDAECQHLGYSAAGHTGPYLHIDVGEGQLAGSVYRQRLSGSLEFPVERAPILRIEELNAVVAGQFRWMRGRGCSCR